ncbi:MAG: transposase [Chloroflexi bacterium HGW-Chloroflexi-7]|nr:MAG: transposase [Chloroflexi bacterium HGW-Chloroflexi-7]
MPKRLTPFIFNHYYHLYNRGINKGLIFFSDRNYSYFVDRLQKFVFPSASIIAYCLMPNHYHLLIKVKDELIIGKSLHPCFVSYVKSINIEQKRIGPLFQSRYQATEIEDDSYLLECVKYIHLNPVKAGLASSPELWQFSSYKSYLNPEIRCIVNISDIMNFFESKKEFQEYSES